MTFSTSVMLAAIPLVVKRKALNLDPLDSRIYSTMAFQKDARASSTKYLMREHVAGPGRSLKIVLRASVQPSR